MSSALLRCWFFARNLALEVHSFFRVIYKTWVSGKPSYSLFTGTMAHKKLGNVCFSVNFLELVQVFTWPLSTLTFALSSSFFFWSFGIPPLWSMIAPLADNQLWANSGHLSTYPLPLGRLYDTWMAPHWSSLYILNVGRKKQKTNY